MASWKWSYKVGCIIVSTLLCIWPIYQYTLDKDLVHVDFKRFHSSEDRTYPALTLCFANAFVSKHNKLIKQKLLKKGFYQIGSHQTTLRMEDYINTITIKDFSNKISQYSKSGKASDNGTKGRKLSTNTVLRRYQTGPCFAIGIPFAKKSEINSINIGIKKDMFAIGNIPTKRRMISGKSPFSVGLSFQNQFFPLLKGNENVLNWKQLDNACSGFVFHVRGMEVVKRRNKPSEPCNDYGNEDALKLLDDVATKLGCKPPHWEFPSPLPDCSSKELTMNRKLLDDGLYDSNAKRMVKPCRSILDLWHDYDFDASEHTCSDAKESFHITVVYNDMPFKEISFVPAYSMWNLAADIGVIFGFVLGFSLFQLPDLILSFTKRWNPKKVCSTYNDKNIENEMTQLNFRISAAEEEMTYLKALLTPKLLAQSLETSV